MQESSRGEQGSRQPGTTEVKEAGTAVPHRSESKASTLKRIKEKTGRHLPLPQPPQEGKSVINLNLPTALLNAGARGPNNTDVVEHSGTAKAPRRAPVAAQKLLNGLATGRLHESIKIHDNNIQDDKAESAHISSIFS